MCLHFGSITRRCSTSVFVRSKRTKEQTYLVPTSYQLQGTLHLNQSCERDKSYSLNMMLCDCLRQLYIMLLRMPIRTQIIQERNSQTIFQSSRIHIQVHINGGLVTGEDGSNFLALLKLRCLQCREHPYAAIIPAQYMSAEVNYHAYIHISEEHACQKSQNRCLLTRVLERGDHLTVHWRDQRSVLNYCAPGQFHSTTASGDAAHQRPRMPCSTGAASQPRLATSNCWNLIITPCNAKQDGNKKEIICIFPWIPLPIFSFMKICESKQSHGRITFSRCRLQGMEQDARLCVPCEAVISLQSG